MKPDSHISCGPGSEVSSHPSKITQQLFRRLGCLPEHYRPWPPCQSPRIFIKHISAEQNTRLTGSRALITQEGAGLAAACSNFQSLLLGERSPPVGCRKTGLVWQGGDHCLLWKPGLGSALTPPGPGQQLATVPGRPFVSQPPLALFTRGPSRPGTIRKRRLGWEQLPGASEWLRCGARRGPEPVRCR